MIISVKAILFFILVANVFLKITESSKIKKLHKKDLRSYIFHDLLDTSFDPLDSTGSDQSGNQHHSMSQGTLDDESSLKGEGANQASEGGIYSSNKGSELLGENYRNYGNNYDMSDGRAQDYGENNNNNLHHGTSHDGNYNHHHHSNRNHDHGSATSLEGYDNQNNDHYSDSYPSGNQYDKQHDFHKYSSNELNHPSFGDLHESTNNGNKAFDYDSQPSSLEPQQLPSSGDNSLTSTGDKSPIFESEKSSSNYDEKPSLGGHQSSSNYDEKPVGGHQSSNYDEKPSLGGHQSSNFDQKPSFGGHQSSSNYDQKPFGGHQSLSSNDKSPSSGGSQSSSSGNKLPSFGGHHSFSGGDKLSSESHGLDSHKIHYKPFDCFQCLNCNHCYADGAPTECFDCPICDKCESTIEINIPVNCLKCPTCDGCKTDEDDICPIDKIAAQCCNVFFVDLKKIPPCNTFDLGKCIVNNTEIEEKKGLYFLIYLGLNENFDNELNAPNSNKAQVYRKKIQEYFLRVYADNDYYQDVWITEFRELMNKTEAKLIVRFIKEVKGNIFDFYRSVMCECGCDFINKLSIRIEVANITEILPYCPEECKSPSSECENPMFTKCDPLCCLPEQKPKFQLTPISGIMQMNDVSSMSPFYQQQQQVGLCGPNCPYMCQPSCSSQCCFGNSMGKFPMLGSRRSINAPNTRIYNKKIHK